MRNSTPPMGPYPNQKKDSTTQWVDDTNKEIQREVYCREDGLMAYSGWYRHTEKIEKENHPEHFSEKHGPEIWPEYFLEEKGKPQWVRYRYRLGLKILTTKANHLFYPKDKIRYNRSVVVKPFSEKEELLVIERVVTLFNYKQEDDWTKIEEELKKEGQLLVLKRGAIMFPASYFLRLY